MRRKSLAAMEMELKLTIGRVFRIYTYRRTLVSVRDG